MICTNIKDPNHVPLIQTLRMTFQNKFQDDVNIFIRHTVLKCFILHHYFKIIQETNTKKFSNSVWSGFILEAPRPPLLQVLLLSVLVADVGMNKDQVKHLFLGTNANSNNWIHIKLRCNNALILLHTFDTMYKCHQSNCNW